MYVLKFIKMLQVYIFIIFFCLSSSEKKSRSLRQDNKQTFGSVKDMKETISLEKEMKQKRGWKPWNATAMVDPSMLLNKPNILLILADDLGYGDTSLHPFTTANGPNWPCDIGGILTPELEKMALDGAIMTNFHSAAPVCSPSRASVLTGLFSWRLGALNAFELGQDLSQRNGFLPQVPTSAEIFREAGYFTAHVGKWHLGGMREEYRLARIRGECTRPGPNQHGFEEYISMLDGPGTPRYTFLHRNEEGGLHTHGHNHLLRNDIPLPAIPVTDKEHPPILSDREAEEAIRIMRESSVQRPGQPWFMQVWFNAPHSPWQYLHTGQEVYYTGLNFTKTQWEKKTCLHGGDSPNCHLFETREWRYKTMVSAMDKSIGSILRALKELHLEEKTLVVFTSDNGPERGAGASGLYGEGKRSLMEGGIRVPSVWQWKGVIPANSSSSHWSGNVDLLPTFLEAAGIPKPNNLKIDGVSILPILIQKKRLRHSSRASHDSLKRLFLWHRDTEPFDGRDGRMNSAGLFDHLKVITQHQNGFIYKIFDLRLDPYEKRNLWVSGFQMIDFENYHNIAYQRMLRADADSVLSKCKMGIMATIGLSNNSNCLTRYYENTVVKIKFIMSKLRLFARHGNDGHQYYLKNLEKKSICMVPVYSQIQSMRFGSLNCTQCSIPEY